MTHPPQQYRYSYSCSSSSLLQRRCEFFENQQQSYGLRHCDKRSVDTSRSTHPSTSLLRRSRNHHSWSCPESTFIRMLAKNYNSITTAVSVFDNDFVAPAVMQFLDIPSLVTFASSCHHHRALLVLEIQRRKTRFRVIQSEIQNIVSAASTMNTALLPNNRSLIQEQQQHQVRRRIQHALTLVEEAKRLIDSGLDWLDSSVHVPEPRLMDEEGRDESSSNCSEGKRLGWYCSTCCRDKFFLEERLLLKPHSLVDLCSTTLLLPTLFYCSSTPLMTLYNKTENENEERNPPCVRDGGENHVVSTCTADSVQVQEDTLLIQEMCQLIHHLWNVERLSYSRSHASQVFAHAIHAATCRCECNPYVCNWCYPLRLVETTTANHHHHHDRYHSNHNHSYTNSSARMFASSSSSYDMEQVHHQLVQRTARQLVQNMNESSVSVRSISLNDAAASLRSSSSSSSASTSTPSPSPWSRQEAFRIASRRFIRTEPNALPFLLWILAEIDELTNRRTQTAFLNKKTSITIIESLAATTCRKVE